MLEDLDHLAAGTFPIFDEGLERREILGVVDRHVADQRLTSDEAGKPTNEMLAEFLKTLLPLFLFLWLLAQRHFRIGHVILFNRQSHPWAPPYIIPVRIFTLTRVTVGGAGWLRAGSGALKCVFD